MASRGRSVGSTLRAGAALLAASLGLIGCAAEPNPAATPAATVERAPAPAAQHPRMLVFEHDLEVAAAEKRFALGPLAVYNHPDVVNRIAFRPGDTRLAVGGMTGAIRVWDIRDVWRGTGMPPAPLRLKVPSSVSDLAFAPDGTLVAVTDVAEDPLHLWTAQGTPIPAPATGVEGPLYSVAISPSGLYLAVGGAANVTVFNMRTRSVVATLTGHVDPVRTMAFNDTGRRLLTGSADSRVFVWSIPDWRRVNAFRAHPRAIADLAIQPETGRIATASYENAIKLWPPDGQGQAQILSGHGKWVTSLAFNPEGHQLASASADGSVRYWDVAQGQPTGQAPISHTGAVNAVAYNSTGRLLATGGEDRTVNLIALGLPRTFLVGRIWMDWQTRPTMAPPFPLSSLEVLSATPIPAGENLALRVTVRNTGHDDLFRVKGLLHVSAAGDGTGIPLYFGRIAAGEEIVRDFLLPTDPRWGVRETSVRVTFQEANGVAPAKVDKLVALDPRPHPRLSALVLAADDGSGRSAGNGDGALQENEGIDLHIRFRNEGQGPATGTVAKVRVLGASQGIRLFSDTLEVGDLAPGASGGGVITMQLIDAGSPPLRLEIAVHEKFWNETWVEVIELPVGEPTSQTPRSVSRKGVLAADTELYSGASGGTVVARTREPVTARATAMMNGLLQVQVEGDARPLWVQEAKLKAGAAVDAVLSRETLTYQFTPLSRQ